MEFVAGLPLEIFYLVLLIAFVVILFLGFKRPIYETMFWGYCFSIVMTGRYDLFGEYLLFPAINSSLFYIIVGFLALAYILDKTDIVNKIIQILVAALGRIPGSAGYVALISSSLMAMMTGTGPGNVAASGVFTIPAMKKTGFSSELAATTEMSASMLGNQMGPGLNLLGFSILVGLYPEANYNLANFWLALWVVGFWLFLQRLITIMILCKKEGVKPIPPEERPDLKKSFKEGWTGLLLPLFIFVPIILSSQAGTFLQGRYGVAGEEAFSGTVLMFTIGVASIYALFTGRKGLKEREGEFSFKLVYGMFRDSLKSVVPVGITIYFAYALSQIFNEVAVGEAVEQWFLGFNFGPVSWAIAVTVLFAIFGMVLPGSTQVALLGSTIITTGAAVGLNPFVIAAVMPSITGVLEGMTPPMALGLYTAMGIAKSEFKATSKLALLWVALSMLVSILAFLGILPIPGV